MQTYDHIDPAVMARACERPTQAEIEDAKQRLLDQKFAKLNKVDKDIWDDLQAFKRWTADQLRQISLALKTGSSREGISSLKAMQDKIDQLDEEVGALLAEVFPDGTDGGNATAPMPSSKNPDFS